MPLLCPALSRERGWSCCQWEGEGKRQEHTRGAHETLAPALRGDRDVGLGVGPLCRVARPSPWARQPLYSSGAFKNFFIVKNQSKR